jgi:hypothetical protein
LPAAKVYQKQRDSAIVDLLQYDDIDMDQK